MIRKSFGLALAFLGSIFVGSCVSKKSSMAPTEKTPELENSQREISPLHSSMYQIAGDILELQNYSSSEKKFQDPKNHSKIEHLIDSLNQQAVLVLRQKKIQSSAYRISGLALEQHFHDIRRLYQAKNFNYSRLLITSTPTACASCHTQLPNSPPPLWQLTSKDISGSPMEKAELLFATRNFDQALKAYSEIIKNSTEASTNLNEHDLKLALKRKLIILLRVKRDFQAAKQSLEEDQKNLKLPSYISEEMDAWLKSIRKELRQKRLIQGSHSLSKLLSLAEDVYAPSKAHSPSAFVDQLYVSGLLYEKLHNNPQDEKTQELLLWLGSADSTMNNDLFFGLSFAYFRECIDKDSSTLTAKRCFNRYESNIIEMYTGSRGYDPPPEVEEDLRLLKSRVGLDQI